MCELESVSESKEELAHREVRHEGRTLCLVKHEAWGSSALSRWVTPMSY